jgi:hypothetical protein
MGMKALLNKAGFSKRSETPIYELVYVLVLWVWLKKDSIGMFAREIGCCVNLAFFEPRNFSNKQLKRQ